MFVYANPIIWPRNHNYVIGNFASSRRAGFGLTLCIIIWTASYDAPWCVSSPLWTAHISSWTLTPARWSFYVWSPRTMAFSGSKKVLRFSIRFWRFCLWACCCWNQRSWSSNLYIADPRNIFHRLLRQFCSLKCWDSGVLSFHSVFLLCPLSGGFLHSLSCCGTDRKLLNYHNILLFYWCICCSFVFGFHSCRCWVLSKIYFTRWNSPRLKILHLWFYSRICSNSSRRNFDIWEMGPMYSKWSRASAAHSPNWMNDSIYPNVRATGYIWELTINS